MSAKSDADLTPLLGQSLTAFNLCTMLFEVRLVFLVFHSSSRKDASMLRRLKKYQESGPIKDSKAVVVLRKGNTGFPNVAPCIFIGCRTMLLQKMWD